MLPASQAPRPRSSWPTGSRDLGYRFATKAGISICVNDMVIPQLKEDIIYKAQNEIQEVEEQYNDGLITEGEKYNKVVDIWTRASDQVAIEMMKEISTDRFVDNEGQEVEMPGFNPIFMMAESGARGSKDQMRQLAGMRGLMAKPTGEIIEQPITANFREGLTVLQYFVSTHGARKGLADTALKTANSGYLTRRLVDVAQDAIISEKDCHTMDGIWVEALREAGEVIQPLGERIVGRAALDDIRDPYSDEILVAAGDEIDEEAVARIDDSGLDRILIRSVLTCRSKKGVCAKCYGRDLAHGDEAEIGEAIGIIAAQSIGEPGTQLTMRTFHIGGTASRRAERHVIESDLVGGSIEFSPDVRLVRSMEGELVVMSRKGELIVRDEQNLPRERHQLIYGAHLKIKKIVDDVKLLEWNPEAGDVDPAALDKVLDDSASVLAEIEENGLADKLSLSALRRRLEGHLRYWDRVLSTLGVGRDAEGRPDADTVAGLEQESLKPAIARLTEMVPVIDHAMLEMNQVLAEYDMKDSADQTRLQGDYQLRIVKPDEFVEWDPFTTPILTEVSGYVRFVDVDEGKTMIDKVDAVTGKSSKVITESRDPEARPRITLTDDNGKVIKTTKGSPARYLLPVNAILLVDEKQKVFAGDVLAKIPRETTKTKDITGGLPRVAELFEVRKPKEVAVISEIDGLVSFGKQTKGKRKVIVTPDIGDPKEYLIPKGKHVTVHEGDFIRAGEPLMDGSANPHDILSIRGLKELAKYLVDEVQQVYRLQGVKIHDKHIEVIVRQMLRKVKVKSPGDSDLLIGEQVDRQKFEDINESLMSQGMQPAVGEPLLQGITKASLSTESFISAASFQETTKVLTEAAVAGKIDHLAGLKENVIMGRLIPAGSGMPKYLNMLRRKSLEAA